MQIIRCNSDWMKVKVYVINKGTPSEYYGLKSADEGDVLYGAPNNWKTRKGAERWAEKHGYEVVESADDIYCETVVSDDDYNDAEDENEVKSIVQEICDHYKFSLQKFLFSDTRYGSYYFIKCKSNSGYGVTAIIDTDYHQVSIKVNADVQSSEGADILAKQIDAARDLTDEICSILNIRW